MKKLAIALGIVAATCLGSFAQKFALVDMQYILRNVPAYEMANEQLNQVSQRWEKEVNAVAKEAETMYKNYEADMVFLTDEQKKKREEEIVSKENEAKDLRYKYFGPEGELYKKRQSLMKPILQLHRGELPVRQHHRCVQRRQGRGRGKRIPDHL